MNDSQFFNKEFYYRILKKFRSRNHGEHTVQTQSKT
jgi:hypothetical protein